MVIINRASLRLESHFNGSSMLKKKTTQLREADLKSLHTNKTAQGLYHAL